MKRLFNILGCVAAFAGIIAGMSACIPDGIHHRGGGYEPDPGPVRPGGDEPGTSNDYVLEFGYADYYGQYYTKTTDNYLLYLYAGDTDDEGYFKKSGIILALDLLLSKGTSIGDYPYSFRCSDNGEDHSFIPTYKSKESDFDGSSLYIQTGKDVYATYAVTGGTVQIQKKVTGVYEIEADIVTEGDVKYHFSFKGMIDIEDKTQGGGEVDPVDPGTKPSFPGPEGSEWAARALFQSHLDDNKTDEYTLFLYLGDYAPNGVDFKTSGSEIAIELFTNNGAGNSIASGTYQCISSDPEPFTFFDGYYWTDDDGNNVLDPSYFYRQYSAKEGDFTLEAVTGGNLRIEKGFGGNDMYSIEFAYNTESNKSYKINYEGPVKFDKASTKSQTKSAGLKAVRSSASGRILPPVKREVPVGRVTR